MSRGTSLAAFLVFLLVLFGGYQFLHPYGNLEGERRPEIPVTTLSGIHTRLPVPFLRKHVLFLFTPGCPHCRTELANLQQLHPLFPSVEFFAVSLGNQQATSELLASLTLPFPVFLDTDRSAENAFAVRRVPVLLYIDEEDVIQRVLTGARSFREDSLLLYRFSRSGSPGASDVGGHGAMDVQRFPESPAALNLRFSAPVACSAGAVPSPGRPVGPRSPKADVPVPDGPQQVSGSSIHYSLFKKEVVQCVPILQG